MQILKIATFWSKHAHLIIILILEENYRNTTYLKYSYTHFCPQVLIQKLTRELGTFCIEVWSCRSTVYPIEVYPIGKGAVELSGLPPGTYM
jgi:hypothetical protein